MPLKCIEVQDGSKEKPHNKVQRKLLFLQKKKEKFVSRWRKLLDNSSETESGKQNYVTFRSCVPVGNEEKVSVLGFEVRIFLF